MATPVGRHIVFRVVGPRGRGCRLGRRELVSVIVQTWPSGPSAAEPEPSMGLAIVGELDAHSAPLVARALDEMAGCTTHVSLDMSGVSFADAAAVTLLIGLRQRVMAQGGHLELRAASDVVERLLTLTGVDARFPAGRAGRRGQAARGTVTTSTTAAPPSMDPAFEVVGRRGGQVIDLMVRGDVADQQAVEDVEDRILRLVSVRQPVELTIDLTNATGNAGRCNFARVVELMDGFGGVVTIARPTRGSAD